MYTNIKRRKLTRTIDMEMVKLEIWLKRERKKINKELKENEKSLLNPLFKSQTIPKNVTDFMPSYKTVKATKLFIKNMPEIIFDYDPTIQIYDPTGWHTMYKHNEIFLIIPSLKLTFTITEKGVGVYSQPKINPSLKGGEKRKLERLIINQSIEML